MAVSGLHAQEGVGIGITKVNGKAVLQIQPPSNNKGLLIPRLTTAQRNAIGASASEDGLMVYDTDQKNLFYYHGAYGWQELNPLPQGSIIMWSGTAVPAGWAICDGTSGTPDLRGRFIVSSGTNSSPIAGDSNPKYLINQKGGRNQVTLTSSQSGLPTHSHTINHTHTISDPGHDHKVDNHGNEDVGDANKQASYNRNNNSTITTESSTTGITINNYNGYSGKVKASNATTAHENRPPYYVLAFIMKL